METHTNANFPTTMRWEVDGNFGPDPQSDCPAFASEHPVQTAPKTVPVNPAANK